MIPPGIEEFLLNSGGAGIVILGLLWEIRASRAENKELRAQNDAIRDAIMRERDATIRDLINRGGLHHGGHTNG